MTLAAAQPIGLAPADVQKCASSILELSVKTYWEHAWILQEYTLAQKIDIWCGELSLEGDALNPENWEPSFERSRGDPAVGTTVESYFRSPMWEVIHGRSMKGNALEDVVLFIGPRACADVRDRIYSLCGLIRPEVARKITPDYSESASDLFHRVVVDCDVAPERAQQLLDLGDDDTNVIKLEDWRYVSWMANNASAIRG